MRVTWIVSTYPHPAFEQGGIFYRILGEALVAAGVELQVIAPTPMTGSILPLFSHKWKRYADAPRRQSTSGVEIERPRYLNLPGSIDKPQTHLKILRALNNEIHVHGEIIHAFGSYPENLAAQKFAQERGLPFIQTFIGSDVNNYPERGPLQKQLFKQVCDGATRILTVSQQLADRVHALTGHSAEVMYMPVNTPSVSHLSKEAIRAQYGVQAHEDLILYAGNLLVEKGILDLCEALNSPDLTHVKVLFAGPSSPLQTRIEQRKNNSCLGSLPHAALLELMSAADALILPSHSEGIPGVIKEAGQMKLPVIATTVGGIPELLDDTCGYLIPPHSSESISKAILEVLSNKEESKSKAEQLHSRIQSRFAADQIVTRLVSIYHQLLHGNTH